MRLTFKPRPEHMATRTRRVFLLWPRSTDCEWRWLEWAVIKERYWNNVGWTFVRFVDPS